MKHFYFVNVQSVHFAQWMKQSAVKKFTLKTFGGPLQSLHSVGVLEETNIVSGFIRRISTSGLYIFVRFLNEVNIVPGFKKKLSKPFPVQFVWGSSSHVSLSCPQGHGLHTARVLQLLLLMLMTDRDAGLAGCAVVRESCGLGRMEIVFVWTSGLLLMCIPPS